MDFMSAWFLCVLVTTAATAVVLFKKMPQWVSRAVNAGPRSDLAVAYGVMIPVITVCGVVSIPMAYLLVLLMH